MQYIARITFPCYFGTMITDEARKKERELLLAAQKETPHLFVRNPFIDNDAVLKLIGIEGVFKSSRPIAYIRLYPSDFIVEEIAENGQVRTVDFSAPNASPSGSGPTLYMDLVKAGISTFDAKKELAASLGIESRYISSAGLKDESAITSQRIGIRHVNNIEALTAISSQRFFLKNISRGKGYLGIGRLLGNRFTIVLRPEKTLSPLIIDKLRGDLEELAKNGFWNFFYTQRFGIPRLITHLEGLLLVSGHYEEAIKACFTYLSPYEIPYFHEIRKKISEAWGDWEMIDALIRPFPIHFISERILAGYLKKNPGDFIGALRQAQDETRIWAFSYASYLCNRKLSQCIKNGDVPEKLPLITSFQKEERNYYKELIEADEIELNPRVVEDLPFLQSIVPTWPTTQKADVHAFAFQENLAVISFSLPKGAYATSFLSNLFTLASDLPALPGISTSLADAKKMLGLGSLTSVLEYFQHALKLRQDEIKRGFL